MIAEGFGELLRGQMVIRQIGHLIYRLNALFWGAVVFVLLGVLALFSILLSPIYILLQKILGVPQDSVHPDALAEFDEVMTALRDGDIPTLERAAVISESFPVGVDGFVGRPWLVHATDNGVSEVIRWMLDKGADPNVMGADGHTPLRSAIHRETDDAARISALLIARGARVNDRDALRQTPLHEAAFSASEEIVRLLLEHGAEPDALNGGSPPESPAEIAERAERPEIAALIRKWEA